MATFSGRLAILAAIALLLPSSDAASIQRRDLEAPIELDNGWEYEGCYVDAKRTINEATRASAQMTNEMCADFCFEGGYAYFGTEYYEECFCGDKLAKGGVKATEPECNTPCRGDPEQPCGGPDRLTLYKRPARVPKVNPGWDDYESIGCYSEGTTGRALSYTLHSVPDSEMSVRKCIEGCAEADFILAGVEFGGECFCGNTVVNGGEPAEDDDECNMRCKGNATELCGGRSRLNVYDFELQYTKSLEEEEEEDQTTTTSSRTSTTTTHSRTSSSAASTISTTTSATSSEAPTLTTSRSSDSSSIRSSTSSSATSDTTSSAAISSAQASQSSTSASSSASTSASATTSSLSIERTSVTSSTSVSSAATSTSPTSGISTSASSISSASTPASSTPTQSSSATSVSVSASSLSSLQSSVASTTTVSEAAEEEPTQCPYQPEAVGDWSWYGCYTEATGARALAAAATASDDMTIAMCAEFCAGYTYFGVEYSKECFCGNSFSRGSVLTSASECNMICGGSECNYCGAGNRLSVYTIGDAPPPPSTTDDVEPSETLGPVATGIPDGWDYYGCWVDNINGRILTYQAPDNPQLTIQSCISHCSERGYTVAAPQYHTQCFCGNEIINGGELADKDSECNTACGGNSAQSCGGPNRMSVFSRGEPDVFGPPGPVASVGDWVYQGCAEDNVGSSRTFPWQLIFEDTLTPEICVEACAEFGYMAAGLEYGIECYCGDPANIDTAGADFVDETQCNIPCAGNGTTMCGGGARMTTYFYEGDKPFYSWDFPEAGTPEAGRYQFLIGGVVIPLMASQAVNGKVTFLEKWGTGPPNSTGAYELDLSLTDDFSAAWRTMHVKTDLFCAAGVTLPDKAGRQLTVGGWSGDSTYGVRLYTPDGEPGTPGTNDWEENVDILSLQDGRWYPSTLNMANGSILVVGGEEGSNGAPVPTLEILPNTGTAPLYMEWLERTDPNNLYPFLAVLPSKGIFVAYWNEARILDEKTFETIQLLPNIPGAVNDPMGGRTYPLEGTAVLLPQKAPYTDPLGVFICGGSTVGIATALDNCVTIFPDAAEPEWTIERMPSKRVMSLMAPLPDGTYLILGGAKQGVAGFGLANTPNQNAVLYDPSKPLHSRMTVMANTTVARMYHSEALTLLDGRVLISGSDPQDGVNPQEYRVEVFHPPYLLDGSPRPSFSISNTDWAFEEDISFTVNAVGNGELTATLLGAVSSTHGNSMGSRTLHPALSCSGSSCTVTAPPGPYVCTPGWYQFFVLDGGIPAVGVYVRIGGDPAELGNWPDGEGFTKPGL